MAEEESGSTVHRVKVPVKVGDEASAAIEGIARAGERMSRIFEHFTGIVTAVGGLAGIFEIHETVAELGDTYSAIERIRALTGLTADRAGALVSTFKATGMPLMEAERAIRAMSLRGQQLDDGMLGIQRSAGEMHEQMKRLGIDMKKGPENALVKMSEAVRAGKLDAHGLQRTFGLMPRDIGAMMTLLQRGPDAVREQLERAKNATGAINEGSLRAWQQMKLARAELSEAWEHLVNVLYTRIVPALVPLLEDMTQKIEQWTPAVEKFGAFLAKHMDAAVRAAKLIFYYTAASKVTGLITGQSVGGLARMAAGGVGGAIAGESTAFAGLAAGVGTIAAVLAPIVAIGAVIGSVVLAWRRNIDNIAGMIRNTFGEVIASFEVLFSHLRVSLGPVTGLLKDLITFIGHGFLNALELILESISQSVQQLIALGIKIKHPLESWQDAQDEALRLIQRQRLEDTARADAAANRAPPDIAPVIGNQYFINPRFDIHQEFDKDFDPDRVLMVFSNDLAKLGERARQSGFAPLYTVR